MPTRLTMPMRFNLMDDLFGRDKISESIKIIKMFEPKEGYYLAFSGGKDSQCIFKLTIMAEVKFDAHYSVCPDPPELVKFIRKQYPSVIWEYPKIPFFKAIVQNGFPTRTARWCCKLYKENGGSGRIVLTGIRKEESHKRAGRRTVERCYRDESKTFVNPILDWSENEVWEFLKGLPHCSLYDIGQKRVGCVLCPNNSNRILERIKYPKYVKAYLKAFENLYEKNKENNTYIKRWKNGREMFDWWLSNSPYPDLEEDQGVLFE